MPEPECAIHEVNKRIRRSAVKGLKLTLILCLMLIVVMTASLMACAKQTPAPAPAAKYGGILRYGGAVMPTSTIGWPAKMMEQDSEVVMPILETLVREDN